MPRPTPAQICWGTLVTVSATVVMLAVSGTDSLPVVTVLVVVAVALGTLAAALPLIARSRRAEPAASRVIGSGGAAVPAQGRGRRPAQTADAGFARPSSGRP
ncbi:hypothetical protein ACIQGZ_24330 [Streptomyces sp. NPDC092296]|uniref:hypothetical protein n=1 Tax=Streptomyces sp. NPDC092296 TaxID=3366012 RepID=UPI0038247257